MKIDKVEIEVRPRVTVDKLSAYRALKILEWYLNDSGDELVISKTDNDVTILGFKSVEVKHD